MKKSLILIFFTLFSNPTFAAQLEQLEPIKQIGSITYINPFFDIQKTPIEIVLSTGTGAKSQSQISTFFKKNLNSLGLEGSLVVYKPKSNTNYRFDFQLETQEVNGNDNFYLWDGFKWMTLATSAIATQKTKSGYKQSAWHTIEMRSPIELAFLLSDTKNTRGTTKARIKGVRKVSENFGFYSFLLFSLFLKINPTFVTKRCL